jgi:hypothetical protein
MLTTLEAGPLGVHIPTNNSHVLSLPAYMGAVCQNGYIALHCKNSELYDNPRKMSSNSHYQQHSNRKLGTNMFFSDSNSSANDVESFEKAWRNLDDEDNINLVQKLPPGEFHQLQMHNMQSFELLTHWASQYAKPFLQKWNKDFIYATKIEYNKTKRNKSATMIENVWTEIATLVAEKSTARLLLHPRESNPTQHPLQHTAALFKKPEKIQMQLCLTNHPQ